jgi:uncharacterized protein (TIGR03089 family)
MPVRAERPLITYYDDATGERTELSAAELARWASRTARLLGDGCGLGAGDRAAVLLPPHWQTAAVLLGAWSAGLMVSVRLAATAGLPVLGPGADDPVAVTFAARHRIDDWLDDIPDAPHRFALATRGEDGPPPPGYRDFRAEAGRYEPLDEPALVRPDAAASIDGTTYRQWGELGRATAEVVGLRPGDRVLVDTAEHEHPAYWLLAPLAVGASVVLCANPDPATVAARVAAEGVTRRLDGAGRPA